MEEKQMTERGKGILFSIGGVAVAMLGAAATMMGPNLWNSGQYHFQLDTVNKQNADLLKQVEEANRQLAELKQPTPVKESEIFGQATEIPKDVTVTEF
jgi:hypothetical protein